ncbi:hypothetical protein L3Q82_016745 [Scortum barcoo]|uniref:Uncharacterized protein n=1 Tax=Scortum barcoo TaxID=214431 RepID=A0ACB8X7Z1_9TELE|nr:hypothetical protein L3Q82_016745 [Scortum barcoo]
MVEDGEELYAQFMNTFQDPGSQVTTVPELFYKQYYPGQEIKPLFNLLEVKGAAGQSVPYLGYIELPMTFPRDFVGKPVDVNTLALVVPDVKTTMESLVLIGTNTLDVLYDIYSRAGEAYQPVPHGYRAVLKILEVRHKQMMMHDDTAPCGVVRLQGNSAQVITAGEMVVLEGVTSVNGQNNEKSVIIEQPSSPFFPGGSLLKLAWLIFLSDILSKSNDNIDELKNKNGDDTSESREMAPQHHPVGKEGDIGHHPEQHPPDDVSSVKHSNYDGKCGHCYKCGSAEHWAAGCHLQERKQPQPP